jgi:hypothetical protein
MTFESSRFAPPKEKLLRIPGAVLEFVFDSLSAVGRRMGARERLSR